MTDQIHLDPCCETTPELIPAVSVHTGKHFWFVYCPVCRKEVWGSSPETAAENWNAWCQSVFSDEAVT